MQRARAAARRGRSGRIDAFQLRTRSRSRGAQGPGAGYQVVVLAVTPGRIRGGVVERRGDARREGVVRGRSSVVCVGGAGGVRSSSRLRRGRRTRGRARRLGCDAVGFLPEELFASLHEGVDLHAGHFLEEESDGLRVDDRVDFEIDVEAHDALSGPRPGLEAPGADEALEKASLDAALARDRLGGDGLATARALVNQGDVRDVAFVEEPEADLELRLEVAGETRRSTRDRAQKGTKSSYLSTSATTWKSLGRVSHRLGGREGLGAYVVEIWHREERGGRGGGPLQGCARATADAVVAHSPWRPCQRCRRAARRGGRHPVRCFARDNLKGAARRPTPVESAAPQGSEDTAASCGPKGGFVQPSG